MEAPVAAEEELEKPGTKAASAEDKPTDADNKQTENELEPDIRGRVVAADGKPVAGAKFFWMRTRVHDLRPMPAAVGLIMARPEHHLA